MQIKPKSKKQKYIIISVLLIVLLIGTVGSYTYFFTDIFRKSDSNTPSPLEGRTLDGINNAPATEEQANGGESAKKDLAASETQQPSPVGNLSVDLTAFKKNNGEVRVTANIQNVTLSSGTCNLSITKGDATKTYQSDITAVAGYSTCKGFDIPGLDSGTWQIRIDIVSNEQKGSSTTSIEV